MPPSSSSNNTPPPFSSYAPAQLQWLSGGFQNLQLDIIGLYVPPSSYLFTSPVKKPLTLSPQSCNPRRSLHSHLRPHSNPLPPLRPSPPPPSTTSSNPAHPPRAPYLLPRKGRRRPQRQPPRLHLAYRAPPALPPHTPLIPRPRSTHPQTLQRRQTQS